jgi:hypothetical protein
MLAMTMQVAVSKEMPLAPPTKPRELTRACRQPESLRQIASDRKR